MNYYSLLKQNLFLICIKKQHFAGDFENQTSNNYEYYAIANLMPRKRRLLDDARSHCGGTNDDGLYRYPRGGCCRSWVINHQKTKRALSKKPLTLQERRWERGGISQDTKTGFSVGESPAWSKTTRLTHILAAIIGVAYFERIKFRLKPYASGLNPHLFLAGPKAAHQELENLQSSTY